MNAAMQNDILFKHLVLIELRQYIFVNFSDFSFSGKKKEYPAQPKCLTD